MMLTDIRVRVVGITMPLIDNIDNLTDFIAYQAKISGNQGDMKNSRKLINYLIDHSHWSPFEMAHIQVEVECPRDIARQMLRHRSASFQEFSQRYSDNIEYTVREIRAQDPWNRQNSLDVFPEEWKEEWEEDCSKIVSIVDSVYKKWRDRGAAKECVRVILPEGLTMSKLYMSGSVRTWLHYLDVREGNGTQLEHIMVANAIREELAKYEPEIFE